MKRLAFLLRETLLESSFEALRKQYVDTGKLPEDVFDEIVRVCDGSVGYGIWLAKRVADKVILPEDVYKWEEYFKIFKANNNDFDPREIGRYKSPTEVDKLRSQIIAIQDKASAAGVQVGSGGNLVNVKDVKKLESVGIELLGLVEGYQVFKIPGGELVNDEEAWKAYRSILGRCKTGKIGLCTMAFSNWKNYMKHDTYVFFNMNDPRSPYQFTYEANMFKDKNDADIWNSPVGEDDED